MNKSIKILEALNDIDETLLVENVKKINTKDYHQILNEMIINMKKIRLKYALTPVLLLAFILVSIVIINSNDKNKSEIAKSNEITENINIKMEENNIIFNTNNIRTLIDIDGIGVKTDVVSKFEFLNNLEIPKEYSLIEQLAVYEKENVNDTEYTKLWQYALLYRIVDSNKNDSPKSIEITFTKENHILACMLPDKNKFLISIINEKELYLFKSDNNKVMQAFFEHNGYKFFIEASDLNDDEFVNLIQSIIK